MKVAHKILTLLLFLPCASAHSQQEGAITHYMYHMNVYNPAYVGDGETVAAIPFRQQWTGIKDAPSAEAVSLGTSLGNNIQTLKSKNDQ
tara:strand:- start:2698 stop:2964 length:267 start_codon:yes stop_codon:yes gene_type:complete